MSTEPPQGRARPNAHRWIRVGVMAGIIALFGGLVWNMPRGYQTDLARISQGKPALTLVYDSSFLISEEQMAELERVRANLEPRLHLLVADVNLPNGRAFARKHEAEPGTLLILAADGTLIERITPPSPAKRIQERVERALSRES